MFSKNEFYWEKRFILDYIRWQVDKKVFFYCIFWHVLVGWKRQNKETENSREIWKFYVIGLSKEVNVSAKRGSHWNSLCVLEEKKNEETINKKQSCKNVNSVDEMNNKESFDRKTNKQINKQQFFKYLKGASVQIHFQLFVEM